MFEVREENARLGEHCAAKLEVEASAATSRSARENG